MHNNSITFDGETVFDEPKKESKSSSPNRRQTRRRTHARVNPPPVPSDRDEKGLFSFAGKDLDQFDLPFAKSRKGKGKGKAGRKTAAYPHLSYAKPKGYDLLSETTKPYKIPKPPAAFNNPAEKLKQLKTSEDAIAYFALHGTESEIKFVHFNRARTKSGLVFRPYDLEVVPRDKVNPEHFVMSTTGFVHKMPGQPSEFISRSDWTRESSLFHVISNITFFKNYLMLKSFLIWRTHIRFKLYCQLRRRLAKNFFLARETFCAPLLAVQDAITDIQDVPLMTLERGGKAFKHNAFTEAQKTTQETSATTLESFVEKSYTVVKKVCETAVRNVKAFDDVNQDMHNNVDTRANKHKPICVLKEEAARRRADQKRANKEVGLLAQFIRLVDYMVVQNLVRLFISTYSLFLDTIDNLESRSGLFEISIAFNDEGTAFVPSCSTVLTTLIDFVKKTRAMIDTVPRILYWPTTKTYIPPGLITDAPRIGEVVMNDSTFVTTDDTIITKIKADFHKAHAQAELYSVVRPIYEADKVWDPEAFDQREHTVQTLKEELENLRRLENEMDKMTPQFTIGVLTLESRQLKNTLRPMLDGKAQHIKRFLSNFSSNRCREALDRFQECVKDMRNEPNTLKDFCEYVYRIKELVKEDQALLELVDQVKILYGIIKEFEVKEDPQDTVQREDLESIQADYRTEMQSANEFKGTHMQKYKEQLSSHIELLDERCQNQVAALRSGIYEDPESYANSGDVLKELGTVHKVLDKYNLKAKTLAGWRKILGMNEYRFKELEGLNKLFGKRQGLWETIKNWREIHRKAMQEDLRSNLDAEALDKKVGFVVKDAFIVYQEKVDGVKVHNANVKLLQESVQEFKMSMPVILDLGNPNLKSRHWGQIFEAIGFPRNPESSFNLEDLQSHGIFRSEFADTVSDISGTASGESSLLAAMHDVEKSWKEADPENDLPGGLQFNLDPHSTQRGVWILKDLEEINQTLEDNMVSLQTMLGSRYIFMLKDLVEGWYKKLSLLSDTLDEWQVVQKSWMYLETIFSAEDIQKQLPAESKKFQMVNKTFKQLMRRTFKYPLCIEAVSRGRATLEALQKANERLEDIQRCLEEYLETKRSAFPRFYFLSNDELLEILSQTRDPQAVQPHMSKCFDAVKKLKFGDEMDPETRVEMYGMISTGKGEYVEFSEPCRAVGSVEYWMLGIEKMMRRTMYDIGVKALNNYPTESPVERGDWLFGYPAMTILVVDQVYWSRAAEQAFKDYAAGDSQAVKKFYDFVLAQIEYMVMLVRGDLNKLQRTMLGALLTIDVHGREVVKSMLSKNVTQASDFEWNRQLRYYWDSDIENILIRQTNTEFLFAYEYLGNGMRLVITPLTDIIYMTLTGAVHLKFGGAPAGPAGTGKTETTKDLAKALAINIVVFNCSDGLDFKIMGRFFSGLIQSGAWACFDEFNRIDIEVLSVIAQQILTIQQAIIHGVKEFEFEGKIIPRGENFGVFITMNPGYAGRTELPDNLKALFRPVACMVPDYRMIAEIILFSFGFSGALPLSNKMANLYKLSSEQLSKQDHYDFGMRAVKTVLVCAGQLKKKEPDVREDLLLIRAMRDSNVPKFLERDLPLFFGIIKDLFPGEKVPVVDYGKLQIAIEKELRARGLQVVPSLVTKIIQVHETQLVRHGMMVVGEGFSGKTVNVSTLARAITSLHKAGEVDKDGFYKTVQTYTLNPKSITAGELYGRFNDLSGEWYDGLVPKLVRSCTADTQGYRHWVIFDGPVDAVWIENMNTVLDDNKTLCLANSERIKLSSDMHMMFEVEDLKVASPATVSRCGMVFMEQVQVGTIPLVDTWLATDIAETFGPQVKCISDLIKEYADGVIDYVMDFCSAHIPSSHMNLMMSLVRLCESLLKDNKDDILGHPDQAQRVSEYLFCFAMAWSVGGNCDDKSRPKLNEHLLNHVVCKIIAVDDVPENMYDVAVDFKGIRFCKWVDLVPEYEYDHEEEYFSILVPTADTTKYRYLLNALLQNAQHTLVMGQTGVGKSVIVQGFLNDMVLTEKYSCGTSNYSAQTTPKNLRTVFEASLEKKRKNLLGPPAGKKMLMFIDDLNMPALEEYGAQPPNELLRQVIDSGGYYDTEKLFFKRVDLMTVVSACAPPGGGRNPVSARCIRHFNMIWMAELSSESMTSIFKQILSGFLGHYYPKKKRLAPRFAKASVQIFADVISNMLPTPDKSHYTFNLRDLSKVFQGMLMVLPEKFKADERAMCRLWLHEECRVFRDRLVDADDRAWFNNTLKTMLKQEVEVDMELSEFEDSLFGDYLDREERGYTEITKPDLLPGVMEEYLQEYNITYPTRMYLVFFKDAVMHLSRIARVLRQPRGNALLVGVGGSGRKSLTRLACFIGDFKCRSIEITRGYGMNEWRDDIKSMLMAAGAENKPTVFLYSDSQIVNEACLEDVNNILNSGEVPNLYEQDETDRIVNLCRPDCKKAGIIDTRDNVLAFYLSRVRNNLHIVLAFSPIGASFRDRCRMFPSLVNCCTIDWFNAWPEDALFSVANYFLGEDATAKKLRITDYVEPLCKICVQIHRSVEQATADFKRQMGRQNYTTPTSYLELIKLYLDKLGEQSGLIKSNIDRYKGGLAKLKSAEEMVAQLQIELTALQPKLAKSQKETEIFMEQLKVDQAKADEARGKAAKDEAAAQVVAAEVKVIKDDCQKDLDEALPAYHKAMKALDKLDKNAITEVKNYKTPPALVVMTLEAVCIMFDKKPTWADGKKFLLESTFLKQLLTYDKDNISTKKIKKLSKYIANPKFQPEVIRNVSTAATCLCMWCHAMHVYDRVAKQIAPKKANLAKAEEKLKATNLELQQKRDQLDRISRRLEDLQRQFRESVAKKEGLQRKKERTTEKLGNANKLTQGLANEKIRWAELAKKLENIDYVNVVGNVMVSAGCIAYVGPFTADYRLTLTTKWIKCCQDESVPVSADFTLRKMLGDPVTIMQWGIWGLPADEFSIENGIISTLGRRWPLMIDPQGQANNWIKKMYKENNLQLCKLSDANFLRTLENGIRYGNPVLLENVEEELDPGLEPVLLKQVFKKSGQMLLRLGDTDVPYSKEFKFFITTKLPNPHYMPEVCIKVTIVNFTVTPKGLEDQLLVDVVRNERPDLEQLKQELTLNISNDNKQLKKLEDTILQMLANSSGNILDDTVLIDNLQKSKKTSVIIKKRMAEAEVTAKEIDVARESYRSVANRSSILYFVIASLAHVDPMYQYSLQFFKQLYNQRIAQSQKADTVKERLEILLDDITLNMYKNVCRGLMEKDKSLYAFTIAAQIQINEGSISQDEWQCFLVGPPKCEKDDVPCKTKTAWMTPQIWLDLMRMDCMPGGTFKGFSSAVIGNRLYWRKFMEDPAPEKLELPGSLGKKLSDFQKLLVLRVFRKEKLNSAVTDFVGKHLGRVFTVTPPFDLDAAYQTSNCYTPLIFILSNGADPNDALLQLAKEKGKDGGQLKIVSLGQGQGPIAESLMENGRIKGQWICLQNCHLSPSWMPTLSEILEKAADSEINDQYRLWLTSMPSKQFPISILQNGVKITYEPPRGIRANLLRTYQDFTEDIYNDSTKPMEWQKLLFAVSFYNAIVLERRKFGPIGWNIPYGFMNSDLKTATMMVKNYLEEAENGVPWPTLNTMVGDICFGGRITDHWDERTNLKLLERYFNQNLLDDNFMFGLDDTYHAPPAGMPLEEVRVYIDQLPIHDMPDIFGLHSNANIEFQHKQVKELLDTLILMEGGAGGGGGESGNTDQLVTELAITMQKRLPETIPPFHERMAHPTSFQKMKDGSVESLGVFLGQEMLRFNAMVEVLAVSLKDLQRAIKGQIVMSRALEAMYNCFAFQKIPPMWETVAYPSLKPLSPWIDDCFARLEFVDKWLRTGPPSCFWLSGFFFPQGFMTSVAQTYSRKYQVAVDILGFETVMTAKDTDRIKRPPEVGAYIYGMFMQGAQFDTSVMKITESEPRVLFASMPVIQLKPVIASEVDRTGTYMCPLYKTSRRAGTLSTTGHSTNFVVALDVPTEKPGSHWVRRGVAMLCMLDY